MITQFDRPDDIRKYGLMINGFSAASKNLAKLLGVLGAEEDEIQTIVGIGPYNSLGDKEQDFIHYGRYLSAPPSGLFGAFVTIHFPEPALTKHMPALLGQAGCRFVVKSEDVIATWPLNEVGFFFSPRTGQECGRIILSKELRTDKVVLAAKTPITKAYPPTQSRGLKREWRDDSYSFSIIDGNGKAFDADAAIQMLWGHIGATHGFKRFDVNTVEFNTLANDGTDDDFSAERSLILSLNSARNHHGIDLMPFFNGLVQRAATVLGRKPDMLQTVASALYIFKEIKMYGEACGIPAAYNSLSRHERDPINLRLCGLLTKIDGHISSLTSSMSILGLDLSPYSPTEQDQRIAQKMGQRITAEPERLREQIKLELIDHLISISDGFVSQILSPFNLEWLTGCGNMIGNGARENHHLTGRIGRDALIRIVDDISAKLRDRGIAQAQNELRLMYSALARAQSTVDYPSNKVTHTLKTACSSLLIIHGRLGLKPTTTANVANQVECVHSAFEISDQQLFARFIKPQATRFQSFFRMMDAVDNDLSALVRMYGDCQRLRRYFGLESASASTFVSKPALPLQSIGAGDQRVCSVIEAALG